ncbi:MAG: hypothetical protein ABJC05_05555 [Pyrinomonadaceae bacterium]
MNDTSPAIEEKMREMIMARSGEERFIMGALMFDAARDIILASLPKELPEAELRSRLFERIYGAPISQFMRPSGSGTLPQD